MFVTTQARSTGLRDALPPNRPTAMGSGRYRLSSGIEALVVGYAEELAPALAELRRSMTNQYLAIDLEWKPDFVRGENNPVAVMQLASSTLCLILQLRYLGFPQELQQFLRSRTITYVGMNYRTADYAKMQASFGWCSRDFGSFEDLADVAARVGYGQRGLSALATSVLGLSLPKLKRVTLSNWEAWDLSLEQIQYAALDALAVHHIRTRL
ncbi:hypothetical protein D9Q98_009567 [Chlorella vulgaris]|uniref:3'-5' exonuclease domain-containing protein n=1 Tax=Chlorella vulgaris TaxID=3077 RepID=A0A9D4YSY8_CHLVU|nr:hypothetical protein D9Q98_009567 [Chlorella vulgaris]